ncbi:carbohydrate ABC transporter permease [Paenibacillus sp. GP183]|uniref:carbohydrate ABC transporter permease n=1 Tax=Paenibacillus sp. GP183 TaxID=1882751 RepID=UPI00089D9A98|nr:carbohydrate ABC transporter permease [Paenibacillus sp. GP183]SEC75671.1 carbohydrate ABC transporter membrane protein 2, CUT1 family [Paenibacillus sp. GP183]
MNEMVSNKKNTLFNIVAVIICIIFLFPLYWMIISSLKTELEIFKTPISFIPQDITFKAYFEQVRDDYNIFRNFLNSIIISLSSMIISIILSIPAAYALARFKFKGRKVFILSFLITQMLPTSLILTPLFIIFKSLNLYNTYMAPAIADATIAIPFSVLILRTYFITIPKELDDASRIDGCNPFTSFLKIMVPIALPGVIVSTVFSLLFAWSDLIFALTFINNQDMWPVTSGVFNFMQRYGTQWNNVMAFGVVSVIPVILLFAFLQRYIISGLTNGAVKG